MRADRSCDVAIIGGGPAGLSAALVLGRCRRKPVVIDAGNPRNACSERLHGFLTRDGTPPARLLEMAREEVLRYGVDLRADTVTSVAPLDDGFSVALKSGASVFCRKVLLATGVVDRLPPIENVGDFYGASVHHCPYCDGWEYTDARVAVYGSGRSGAALAIKMKIWTADVVLCTDGPARIPEPERERLARHDVRVLERKIARLEGTAPRLSSVVFDDGSSIERSALFFSTGNGQRSDLLAKLGCEMTRKGAVKIHRRQRSSVPGVFVCGDAAEDSQYAVIAAAHGARAAMAINEDLAEDDFR